jgi:hypothetical protein
MTGMKVNLRVSLSWSHSCHLLEEVGQGSVESRSTDLTSVETFLSDSPLPWEQFMSSLETLVLPEGLQQ